MHGLDTIQKAQLIGMYCARYAQYIYVRELDTKSGRWESLAFADLSPARQRYWIAEWVGRGILPARLKTPEELAEDSEE